MKETFMRYFLAIILPPLAVFLCGKPFQAVLGAVDVCS
ncbi:YqaE/Pmp3 family membrane protein [Endozoicomonas sp. Mp262]